MKTAPYVVVGLSLVGTFSSVAGAAFMTPTDWSRPGSVSEASQALTTYQAWDVFTSVSGPNAPDVGVFNPAGVPDAYDAAAPGSGAFIPGSGNLYSASGVINPSISIPQYDLGSGFNTHVLLQVRSQGALIDTSLLTVNGVDASELGATYTELTRVALGGFGGSQVEHAWAFTIAGNPSSLSIDLGWGVSHASLDRIAVDTQAVVVPEPATVGLALGVAGLLLRRRMRSQA